MKGFSVQNLWYMRQFYLEYHDNEKLQPLVGEISYGENKNVSVHSKLSPHCRDNCKLSLVRDFHRGSQAEILFEGISHDEQIVVSLIRQLIDPIYERC